jgi:hypothetical protein
VFQNIGKLKTVKLSNDCQCDVDEYNTFRTGIVPHNFEMEKLEKLANLKEHISFEKVDFASF